MKLPWDEKYLKISFHVIFTLIVVYILGILVNALAYSFTNISVIFYNIKLGFGRFFSVISPLLISLIISYLFDPLIDFSQKNYEVFHKKYFNEKFGIYIEKLTLRYKFLGKIKLPTKKTKATDRYKKRTAGVIITLLSIILIIGFISIFLVSKIGRSSSMSSEFLHTISKTVNDLNESTFKIQTLLDEFGLLEYFSDYLNNFVNRIVGFMREASNNIVDSIASAGSKILTFFLGLVISIYFLREKEKYLATANEVMDTFIPNKVNSFMKNLLGDIHAIFSGYIRGQLTDAAIMAALISVFLSVLGVKFALIIGVFSGISNIIPYFGAIIAFALSVLMAFISGSPFQALYAAIGILILQQIDGVFIVPKVVGTKVELSPILVLLSLSVAGSMFGIVGMILAVPVCAIIKLFISRFFARQRLKRELAK